MNNTTISLNTLGKIIGITLIIMAIISGIAFGGLHPQLFQTDTANLFSHLQTTSNLLRLDIFLWLMVIVTDIIVSWALHLYLRHINPDLSLVAAWTRLIYTCILATAVSELIKILNLTQIHIIADPSAQIQLLEQNFNLVWSFGLIIFGLHLILIGYIARQTQHIPKIISYLVILAGLSYCLVHSLDLILSQGHFVTSSIETILLLPMTVGELGFGLWLLVKGARLERNKA